MGICRALFAGTLALCFVLQTAVPDEAFAQADSVRAPSLASVNARLDSLEQVALTSDNGDRRWQAALAISGFGRRWMLTQRDVTAPPPQVLYPGIVDRLARIYRQVDVYSVRDLIIGMMIHQAERAEGATFLAEMAQEPPEPAPPAIPDVGIIWDDRWPLQFNAINTLTYMGAEGRAVLQRLYAEGTLQHPAARRRLEELARQGFRKSGS